MSSELKGLCENTGQRRLKTTTWEMQEILLLHSVYLTLLRLGIKHWDHFNSRNFCMDPVTVTVASNLTHLSIHPQT